ncbi:tRNA (adenosine(37)-N6)-dimethylallyltransferase MiaA [Granulicella tundricola]|uniref:tRNA dimethylallyltransferase n=1 Tax=Granulicella tundricola (strain ATCC BAA-1859 / DSM 23138 / MP5ACTX9) TaxID=1198114 RepID=E8X4X1_GRATM|nr:tRNA (adenosine(37)-N6)-dimethylallyltransferase MiaA [Granulicella tundricola]ADW70610.1 tRNA delta(2)-isopentenylpyrophosphate transferase [Granulicella tundricola MP5ACTX9]
MALKPLIVTLGATASGKTALSLALAQRFSGEILSCDSVAVYRHMELGTAKPSQAERALVPHHCLDLYDPNEACNAGDYARHARAALDEIASRNLLPILSGGTGLYLRALLDGLFPSPQQDPALRELLRHRAATRGSAHLHRTLTRLDQVAAHAIHPNDIPKIVRAIEVSLLARRPITEQWQSGRDALTGYAILRLGLDPPRPELYQRINLRAQAMFTNGLIDETRDLIARFGPDCRPFSSLGYAEASEVLRGELTEAAAILQAQQGHRHYAKRQMTWFRREAELHEVHWLKAPGDSPEAERQAIQLVEKHLQAATLMS